MNDLTHNIILTKIFHFAHDMEARNIYIYKSTKAAICSFQHISLRVFHHSKHQINRHQQTCLCPLQQYYTRNFYFNRLPKLWKKLPFINLDHSISTIKTTIYTYLHDHFKNNFASDKPCTYHFCCRCSNCYNQGTPSNFSVM